ncbi:hypothetical protein [Sulfitobacter aestuariivivens]|uniref:Uncharacterized protein n=1 Tax=Sulfitobacter aestuariivivens TaxID=2766981 RepID=A0A927HFD4_9RHOB|nr:hypothetical protein [Sulfitobacter aestuariivivens]MBD3665722.1 hypothetical protein [Sulfitobacter aestuariivivens]
MKHPIFTILGAGALATVAFDAFGQGLSPLLGYAKLAPVGLASQTLKQVFGASPSGAAYLLHTLTGVVFYTLGYLIIARPVQRAVLPNLPWAVTAVVYGVALWVFALYIMAHLVAGMPAFLGFTGITWVALWGHILFAAVAAWVIEAHGISFEPAQRRVTAAA